MRLFPGLSILCAFAGFCAGAALAQGPPPAEGEGVALTVTVTLASKSQGAIPEITSDQVVVKQDGKERRILSWVPARNEDAKLNLVIFVDPTIAPGTATRWVELQNFLRSLPQGTRVATGHGNKGKAIIDQNFTSDLDLAAKTLKFPETLPIGTSGFDDAIRDLCQRWPSTPGRRVLLLVSPGFSTGSNVGVGQATEQAQRSRVVIYTLHAVGTAAIGMGLGEVPYGGQEVLGKLASNTGGKGFSYSGNETALSYQPYLQEIRHLIDQQFLLTFLAQPGAKQGSAHLQVSVAPKGFDVLTPNLVYVPGVR
jgi:Ca-activated chloride channel family protein